jgi:diadenylate cyclase
MSFITIRILDIIDIILVAYMLYQIYMLIRGTVAINIFIGIFSIYVFWLLVKALNMQLLGTIMGQVMGVGAIALIIVFQQEFRRFFLHVGTRYFSSKPFFLERWFQNISSEHVVKVKVPVIVKACRHMADTKTGALIVIRKYSDLNMYIESGDRINADITNRLIEAIFFKNSPLHDGALIIEEDRIVAAACVLPVSDDKTLPKDLGLRHRAALGISETTDAFVIVVSEETGSISYAQFGKLTTQISHQELSRVMKNEFYPESHKSNP